MIDFMIRKGLSSALFSEPGVVNPKLVIEEGCWYLCTDTAELFLGIRTDSGLDLKRINDENIDSVKQEVINAVKPDVDDIKTTVQTVILPKVETVEELKAWIENKEYLQDIDLEGFATEEFVNDAIANCEKESEIYKVDFNAPDYASAVDAYKAGKVLVLVNAAPDINSYAVMNYVSEKYITFTKFLMSRSETYGAFNTYYLRNDNTWEISKEVKLNKVEITVDGDLQIGKEIYKTPSIEGLATEEFVTKKIAEAELADKEADLEAYYTKSEVDALIPEVPTKVSELENDAGYITAASIPDAEIYKVDFNAPDFAAALEAYTSGKLLLLTNAAPDANSYAVMNYVREDKITFTKFLMSRSEAYGAFNTYYLGPDNTWEISKEVRLNKVEANVSGEVNSELTNIKIGKEVYSLPSIDGLASTEYVDNAIANIPETDLSNYYNKAEVDNIINGIEIPSIEGLVTEESFERELDKKADKVPFTTAKFVTRAVGGFTIGDSVKGLSIAELFAKLLGLSDTKPGEIPEIPDTPAIPGEDATLEEITDYLIATETTIYSQDGQGNLVETPFTVNTWTEEEASVQMDGVSTIYTITDDSGAVIESGYQEATDYNEIDWLTVALPSEIKNVKVKMFNPGSSEWEEVLWKVVQAEEQYLEGYTIWTVPEEYEVQSGDTYRFVIVE